VKKCLLLFILMSAIFLPFTGCKKVAPVPPVITPTPVPGCDWSMTTGNAAFAARMFHSSVVYNNAMWVIGGVGPNYLYYNDVWYSINGVDWQLATGNAAFGGREQHTSVVFNNQLWVIGGIGQDGALNDAWHSTNGTDWIEATGNAAFGCRFGHSSVVHDGKIWVIGNNCSSIADV